MPTVLVTDYDFPDVALEREVLSREGIEVETAQASSADEVIDAARGVEGLLVQYAPITEAVFEAVPSLRVVARYGIGVNNVDTERATANDVFVTNVPSYCVDEVPEHALALILACERRIGVFDRAIKKGTWDWKIGKPIRRLSGQTVGLAGFGRLPRHLVQKSQGLGFEFIGYDPYISEDEFADSGVEKVEFENLLARSDIVSIHAPLTPETENMFDADAFQQMKDTATLVNTARGGIVDVDDLNVALRDGEIGAAGLDVMPEEPPAEHPLFERDNVVLTPHVAWYSEQSITQLRRTAAEQVRTVLDGGVPEHVVNEEVLEG